MSTEARLTLAAANVEALPDPTQPDPDQSDSPAISQAPARAPLIPGASASPVVAREFASLSTDPASEGLAARPSQTVPPLTHDGMALREGPHREEIVKRLRRAEGQLRGIVRMLDEGQGCMAVAQQLTAVRKALDAAMTRMAVSYLEQELGERGQNDPTLMPTVEHVGRLISRLA